MMRILLQRRRTWMHQQLVLRCSVTESLFAQSPAAGIDTVGGHKGISGGERDADTGRYMDTPADDGSLHLQLLLLGTVSFSQELPIVFLEYFQSNDRQDF